MLDGSKMRGEKIYEYELDVTGAQDYGLALSDALSGKIAVPPQGARFDVGFSGVAKGRLSGRVQGTDFLQMRSDGRADLDIRASIEVDNGNRIALTADGVATMRRDEPIADILENVSLTTAASGYDWLLTRQVWAIGTVNFATGKIFVEAYLQ